MRATRAHGGLFTAGDLADWEVKIEAPVVTSYRGSDVYRLTTWTQGPAMLQALNILEGFDYYGDPDFPPAEPIRGLLSKDYAKQRRALIAMDARVQDLRPGDPYPFQGEKNGSSQISVKAVE